METILVATQKGGVGKTTLAVNLAFHLAEPGHRVLLIDGDPQGNATSKLRIDDEGGLIPITSPTFADWFDSEEIGTMRSRFGIDFIPTPVNDPYLAGISDSSLNEVEKPKKILEKLADHYDYVILDSPATLGSLLITLLAMADHVFIPVKVGAFGVDGAAGILQTLKSVRRNYNPRLQLAGIIVNYFDESSVEQQRGFTEISEDLADNLLTMKLKRRPPIDTALDYGVPIKSLGYAHVAAKEMNNLCSEMVDRITANIQKRKKLIGDIS